MNTPLAEMLRYNKWASLRLLEACLVLGAEQLDAAAPGVSGTVRELMLHFVGGQQTFVLRTRGRQHEGELNRDSEWPGFDTLLAIANSTGDELIAIAESLDEDRPVTLTYQGKRYEYPASFFLLHAVEHGVEHRTEIKIALNQLGVETPDLDGWEYAAAAGFGQEIG